MKFYRNNLAKILNYAFALYVLAGTSYAGAIWGKQEYSSLNWKPLESVSGEPGPTFAKLWGSSNGPIGILVKMPNGYASKPIARTSDYRAAVISGSVTNDIPTRTDPEMMTRGSFYVQPGGALHVTRCISDQECLVYMEFEGRIDLLSDGVSGQSPGGLKARTILTKDIPWWEVPNTFGNVKLAWVWGERESPEPSGFFLKFKAGFPGFPHTHTNGYDGIVIQGRPKHWEIGEKNVPVTPVGSTFWQSGVAPHDDSCEAGEDCVMYFRMHGKFDVMPYPAPQ